MIEQNDIVEAGQQIVDALRAAGLSAANIAGAVGFVNDAIARYREDCAMDGRLEAAAAAADAWWAVLGRAIADFRAALAQSPTSPGAIGAEFHRETAAKVQWMNAQLTEFEAELKWQYDPTKPRGRRDDWPRWDLEHRVLAVLAEYGVPLDVSADGACLRVMAAVYASIGIDSNPKHRVHELLKPGGPVAGDLAKRAAARL